MNSLVVETALGLILIFAVFSSLVSVLTEAGSRFAGLRGEYLLRGIRSLVDGASTFDLSLRDLFRRKSVKPSTKTEPLVTKVMQQPIIARTSTPRDEKSPSVPRNAGNTKLSGRDRRALPSYVSGRSFSRSLIDVLVPDAANQTTIDDIQAAIEQQADLPESTKRQLLSLLAQSAGDVREFRRGIEEWYDDHMQRVSGWYKRHVRWISLSFAVLLVLAFNVNAVEITRSLYTDQALRGSVVTQATKASQCHGKDPAACLSGLRTEIEKMRSTGLPIGWGVVSDCAARGTTCDPLERVGLSDPKGNFGHDILHFILVLVGWLLMIVATVPGARFWFDALSRLGSLRSSGPKPARR